MNSDKATATTTCIEIHVEIYNATNRAAYNSTGDAIQIATYNATVNATWDALEETI